MNNQNKLIIFFGITTLLLIAGFGTYAFYLQHQEQLARQECVADVGQKVEQAKQQRTQEWELGVGEMNELYTSLISLCMQRQGYK